MLTIIWYTFFAFMVFVWYLFYRIKKIQTELEETGVVKNKWVIEFLLKDQIETETRNYKNKKSIDGVK